MLTSKRNSSRRWSEAEEGCAQVDELSEQLVKAQAQNSAQNLQGIETKARSAQAACARKVHRVVLLRPIRLTEIALYGFVPPRFAETHSPIGVHASKDRVTPVKIKTVLQRSHKTRGSAYTKLLSINCISHFAMKISQRKSMKQFALHRASTDAVNPTLVSSP